MPTASLGDTFDGVKFGGFRDLSRGSWRGAERAAAALPLLLVLACAARAGVDPFAARLDTALSAKTLRGAQISALVVDRADGRVRFERDADRALVPASNQKILTSLAALETFGPAHRFTTWIGADAAPDAEGGVATLFVRGGGDPALTSEDWWRLASDLRLAGLRRVRGDVVLDDSAFDRVGWHPDWGPVSSRAYHAPVSALAANYGAFAVEVRSGGEVGGPAPARIDPPLGWLLLDNRATTGPPGSPRRLKLERAPRDGGEGVRVRGSLPRGGEPRTLYASVSDATRYAGEVLVLQLRAVGIEVGGGVRRGAVPAGAAELLEFRGRPLAEVVRLFMKYSNNAIAESLVKSIGLAVAGRPGSWERGIGAMRGSLERLGLDVSAVRLSDGSGLSRRNRVPARVLVDALRAADASFDFGPELLASLPIAGADGTLRERTSDARGAVRAKTGRLDGVATLSGFARPAGGGAMVFSLLVNGPRDDATVVDAIDAFAAALVD